MPDERKTQQLDIEVTGSVNSSLAKATGITEAQLAKIKDAVNTINKGFSKEAFGGLGPAAEKGFKEVQQYADNFTSSFKATFAGVFSAEILHGFFDEAMKLAGEFVGKMKEISNVAANMELVRTQFAAENKLTAEGMKEWQKYVEQRATAVPITMQAQYEGAKYISESIQETDPAKRMEALKAETQLVQDYAALSVHLHGAENPVAALNEQYTSLALLISNMQKYGVTLEKTIQPLEAAGLNVRPAIMLKRGMITREQYEHWESIPAEERDKLLGDFAKIVHKRGEYESEVMQVLREGDMPGGKAFGMAATIAKTTGGRESSFADVQLIIESKIGDIINSALNPFLEKINTGFTDALPKIDAFFGKLGEKMSPIFNKEIAAFFDTLGKQDWGPIAKDLDKTAEAAAKMFEKMQPLLDWFAKDLPEEIDGLLRLTTAFAKIATAIEKAFDWVVNKAGPQTPAQAASAQTRADLERQKMAEISALPQPKTPEQARDYEAKRQEIEARYKAKLESLNKSLSDLEEQVKKTTGNDFVHLEKAIESTTAALGGFAAVMQTMGAGGMGGGGFGLGSGYGGGGGMTEYGASVPGDQPGGATYDWNSYHGIGAFTQHLVPGQDVAMSQAYARGHYGISPLGFYVSDKDHKMHRWADVTGSKDPTNEDLYRGALGGIFTRPTKALIGEAGPEALIPLSRAGGLGHTFNINITGTDLGMNLREYGAQIVEIIKREISGEFAAMAAV